MENTSTSSSRVSSEEHQHNSHKHPLLSYALWKLDQKRLQKTSLLFIDYEICIHDHSIKSYTYLFKMPKDNNCDCFVFRKVGKCLHVLSFVETAELHEIIKLQPDCSLRSMLYFPIDDMTSVLDETMLIDHNKDHILSTFVQCPKCKRFFNNHAALESHQPQCSPEMISTCSWKCKLPFTCDGMKTYMHVDNIMLSPNELHHLIPIVSRVYDRLDKLNIRTSIIQILAQDPKYQKTLDMLESQNLVDHFFSHHLYLYIVHRLLPYLEKLSYAQVNEKAIPIFTVIRSEKSELSKDVMGFNEEEEIEKRLADCPERYKNKVQELFASFSQENDEEIKLDEYMKDIIQDGSLTSFGTEWLYVIKCLDVKRSVYKGLRRFVDQRKGEDSDTWSMRRNFVYGKKDTELGSRLTNIFGVLPRHRIAGNIIKRALLFSREKYNYDLEMANELLYRELKNYV